ncbi:MAG: hypothetical protein P1Q69_03570 [Candidatus Thorarchaeota archaeon]|nr:hypothetical protein [Candidatus Thorarchaeota archaeon]
MSTTTSKLRYFSPFLFFIIVGSTAGFIIWGELAPLVNNPDVMSVFGFDLRTFIIILLIASIPILFIEYYLLAVPIAGGFLFINRLVKAASYEMNIMNIGRGFSGRHMVRRAAAPALFSVASSDMFRDVIKPIVFQTQIIEAGSMEYALISLMGALVFMPIALLIFMPTWVLNDTGIVTHLKENKMQLRVTPDTQGVGRWISGIFGGYALIAFPMTMFTTHLLPHILTGTLLVNQTFLNALLLIVGLPIFVMAFIIPVVAINERSQTRIRRSVAKIANALGATIVRRTKVEKAQRIVREGILTEEAGKEIVSTAKTMNISKVKEKEIVTSRKSTKKDTKSKGKPKKKKK